MEALAVLSPGAQGELGTRNPMVQLPSAPAASVVDPGHSGFELGLYPGPEGLPGAADHCLYRAGKLLRLSLHPLSKPFAEEPRPPCIPVAFQVTLLPLGRR